MDHALIVVVVVDLGGSGRCREEKQGEDDTRLGPPSGLFQLDPFSSVLLPWIFLIAEFKSCSPDMQRPMSAISLLNLGPWQKSAELSVTGYSDTGGWLIPLAAKGILMLAFSTIRALAVLISSIASWISSCGLRSIIVLISGLRLII
jgi:hypothetical protein